MDQDHCQCIRAECDTSTPRDVYVVDTAHPGSDAFAGAAAAFAASHIALRVVPGQEQLAQSCLQRARVMFEVAGKMQACYCDSNPICAKTYKAEVWEQFMFYAAAWLYKATGEAAFKNVCV